MHKSSILCQKFTISFEAKFKSKFYIHVISWTKWKHIKFKRHFLLRIKFRIQVIQGRMKAEKGIRAFSGIFNQINKLSLIFAVFNFAGFWIKSNGAIGSFWISTVIVFEFDLKKYTIVPKIICIFLQKGSDMFYFWRQTTKTNMVLIQNKYIGNNDWD